MPYSWVCGTGNTEFSPLGGCNGEVLDSHLPARYVLWARSSNRLGWLKAMVCNFKVPQVLKQVVLHISAPHTTPCRATEAETWDCCSRVANIRGRGAQPGVLPCLPATAHSLQKVRRAPLYFFHWWNSAILEVKHSNCLITFSEK